MSAAAKPRALVAGDLGLAHCDFQIAAWGPCGDLVPVEVGRCRDHAGLRCVSCGDPATHECTRHEAWDHCGAPLCSNCEDVNAPKVGDPHRHRQIMHRQKPRIMTEGDL